MGTRGPVPARSDQKRRRNKDEAPVEKVALEGDVTIPAASEAWHPTASAWYTSLHDSGQSRFFEPSDWQAAHFTAALMSDCLAGEGINAQLVSQIRGLMADLLTTEGARRRAGIELERKATEAREPAAANVSMLADRRRRVSDAS